jgi:voltage-gated potassium channel Kch
MSPPDFYASSDGLRVAPTLMADQAARSVSAEQIHHEGAPPLAAQFLVCGLGSLGQFCVSVLHEFRVPIRAITLTQPPSWEVNGLPQMLEDLLYGDCRDEQVLEQALVRECRAVLLVSSDERVNIEAAFAVRLLNPGARLIVRSGKDNLNELVGDRLGNFIAYEPTQLPAPAFAIAALNSEVRGFIDLDAYLLRVVKLPIDAHHRWRDRRCLHELNTQTRRILSHMPAGGPLPREFYQWQPDARVQQGDQLAYIELTEASSEAMAPALSPKPKPVPTPTPEKPLGRNSQKRSQRAQPWQGKTVLQRRLAAWWRSTETQQSKRVAAIVGAMIAGLLLLGVAVLLLTQPNLSVWQAFYTIAMMLLGASEPLFTVLPANTPPPDWMRLMNLLYVLSGTASVAVLYALLTETLLSAKFQLPKKRPPVPEQGHVVLVGVGRIGQRVTQVLQQIRQPLVALSSHGIDPTLLPQLPVVVGDLAANLSKVNLAQAKSIVVTTDDEMANLELALMAYRINPTIALVIRTFDPRLSDRIARLLPYAKVLCAYDLAAEAFVAAAFGENVLNVLRLNGQTVLVTEYFVAAGDTLYNQLLADVAYGFGAVPILHQRPAQPERLMPADDTRLDVGDRLVVLATTDSLQRIEAGTPLPRQWLIHLEQAIAVDARFDGANAIARISGCSLQLARDAIQQLPATLPVPLYHHQALRLVRELGKCQVKAQVVEG